MNKIYYKCQCAKCSWYGNFEIGDPNCVAYNTPVSENAIIVVESLPTQCPKCAGTIKNALKEMNICECLGKI